MSCPSPMLDPAALATISERPALLGDIVLAGEVCAAEAADKGATLEAHTTHLVIHGTLHLLGLDHMTDDEATTMESLERDAMARLGYDDPYGD
jgi:probable rRNA maturation factor